MKKLSTVLLSLSLLASMSHAGIHENQIASSTIHKKPHNIIMIVADGMGPAYITAYRYYADNPKTQEIEQTVFDRYLVGSASTYPASISGYVTDSAAAATALASGHKSYNGAIGMDVNKNPVQSVLEQAKALGKKTGVVVTSQVNHATPAAYISHNESRKNYNPIADSYVDNGINTDVLFGGGWKYFIRENRNLVKEYQTQNIHYIDQYAQLDALPKNQAVLGLFADVGLPAAIDDTDKYRLSTMTKAAIKQLENPKGYFMLIEASQIDWAGHSNDINVAMAEMDDLARTVEFLEDYVNENPETLVILTADHSTGGLTIAANGVYEWRPQLLRELNQSSELISQHFAQNELTHELLSQKLANVVISEAEFTKIQIAKNKAVELLTQYNLLSVEEKKQQRQPNVKKALYEAINQLIDNKTNTGWTGHGHTAVDVPVYAFGFEKQLFQGKIDNTDIAKIIFKLLEE